MNQQRTDVFMRRQELGALLQSWFFDPATHCRFAYWYGAFPYAVHEVSDPLLAILHPEFCSVLFSPLRLNVSVPGNMLLQKGEAAAIEVQSILPETELEMGETGICTVGRSGAALDSVEPDWRRLRKSLLAATKAKPTGKVVSTGEPCVLSEARYSRGAFRFWANGGKVWNLTKTVCLQWETDPWAKFKP